MTRRPAIGHGGEAEIADGEALSRLVHDCVAAEVNRSVLVLRRSLLTSDVARPDHARDRRDRLAPPMLPDRALLFRLPNLDLVAVWRGDAAASAAASLQAIEGLVGGSDDEPAALAEQLVLPRDSRRLLQIIDESRPAPDEEPPPSLKPLDLPTLARLEAGLSRLDVSPFARLRDVCAIGKNGRFVLRWEHRFLSMRELAKTLAPERAIRADPWLFLRLTRALDQRVLALLTAPQEMRGAGPFQLSLNVSSIVSAAFLRFDGALSPALRGEVVLGLLAADILADPGAFLFAREFARTRGYRLLLRSVTADLLPALPLDRMGLDLLELSWSPSLAHLEALPAPPQATVLARADTPGALAWGESHGIDRFRGAVVGRGRAMPLSTQPGDRAVADRRAGRPI